jgi:hypothetical protein
MEEIINEMITQAEQTEDYILIGYVKKLIETMAVTVNCPSNLKGKFRRNVSLKGIGRDLSGKYDSSTWINENLELWIMNKERENLCKKQKKCWISL